MMRLILLMLVLGWSFPAALPSQASDAFEQYDWLRRGDVSRSPALEEDRLTLTPERQRELVEAGHGYADLLWRYEITIRADGEVHARDTTVRYFLSQSGIQEAGNFTQMVSVAGSSLTVEGAFVQRPDGTRVDDDLSDLQVTSASTLNLFSDKYFIVMPFEGLAPGSTAVLVTSSVTQRRDWPLPWSYLALTRWWWPIERFEWIFRWEPGAEEPDWQTNDSRLACQESARREIVCMATRVEPLPIDPNISSPYDLASTIVVAEHHSWAELSETMSSLMSRGRGESPGIAPLLDQILGDAQSPLEKLKRIQRYVTNEIRYVGIEHGAMAVVPASVTETLERRYADCKGKVALFLELAQRAGLEAWGVLIASERFDLGGLVLPSLQYFDHMIACASLGPHTDPQCVDLTDVNGTVGHLPVSLYGSVALDLAAGTDSPRLLDAPPFVWDIQARAINKIECDGRITEVLNREFSGSAAGVLRALVAGMTKRERLRWAEEIYKEVLGVEEPPAFEFEGFEDLDSAVAIHSTMEFPGAAGVEKRQYQELDSWLRYYVDWFRTENRHHPYWMDGARIRTTNSYELCPERKAKFTGATLELESEFGSLRRSYRNSGSKVVVDTVFEIPRAKIEASQLARYRRFLGRSLEQTMIWFSLEE